MKNLKSLFIGVLVMFINMTLGYTQQDSVSLDISSSSWSISNNTQGTLMIALYSHVDGLEVVSENTNPRFFELEQLTYNNITTDNLSKIDSVKIIIDYNVTEKVKLNVLLNNSVNYLYQDVDVIDSLMVINYDFSHDNVNTLNELSIEYFQKPNSLAGFTIKYVTIYYETDVTASINKNKLEDINIKAFNNQLHIESEKTYDNMSVNMYNMNGQEVLNEKFDIYNKKSFDISHIEKGIYIVNVLNSDVTKTIKIVI